MNESSVDPPIGGTVDHLRTHLHELLPSEQRVVGECIEHPDEVVDLSGAGLAERTGTSQATVSRACKRLGFLGFQHLRMLLIRDLGARARESRVDSGGSAGKLQRYARQASKLVENALTTVDIEAFDGAAETIARARRVLLVASGGSAPAAQAVAIRLLAAGRHCEAPPDAVAQQLAGASLLPEDVCIVVTESGENSMTLLAAGAASETGATVVAVTAYSGSRAANLATYALIAGAGFHAWGGDAIGGNLVQMLLLGALEEAVTTHIASTQVSESVLRHVVGIVSEPTRESDESGESSESADE